MTGRRDWFPEPPDWQREFSNEQLERGMKRLGLRNDTVMAQQSDGSLRPARPMRASWEYRLRLSDWLEDTLIPWLRRATPEGP